jgi:copper transport protein
VVIRALAAALVALALLPAAAQAHATLEDTSPERGASLGAAPRQVVLRFSESVETALGAVRVYDQAGKEVQTGAPTHPGGDGSKVAIGVRSGLPEGGYTVTYRVISADSHPVSGGFTFGIGTGAATAGSVADRLAGQDSGPVTSVAFGVVRAIQFAAITLAIGVLAILWLAWLRRCARSAGPRRSGGPPPTRSRAGRGAC